MNHEGKIMLSILIPSIPQRWLSLVKLKRELNQQILSLEKIDGFKTLGEVEILVDDSAAFLQGGLSIGRKRNALVQNANGLYLCFLDDDETISPDYIETILRLCQNNSDVCTFRAFVKLQNAWGLVNMKLSTKENEQFTPEHTINRPPWHTCPVRSEFAKQYEFSDINNAEDFAWIEKVLTHCQTESHTDKIIFQYNHNEGSEADKIENHVHAK